MLRGCSCCLTRLGANMTTCIPLPLPPYPAALAKNLDSALACSPPGGRVGSAIKIPEAGTTSFPGAPGTEQNRPPLILPGQSLSQGHHLSPGSSHCSQQPRLGAPLGGRDPAALTTAQPRGAAPILRVPWLFPGSSSLGADSCSSSRLFLSTHLPWVPPFPRHGDPGVA